MRRSVVIAVVAPVAIAVVLAAGKGVGLVDAPPIGDPGAVVRWGIPVVQVTVDLAMALTLGALVLAPLAGVSRSAPVHRPALILAARAAVVWAVANAVLTWLVIARAAGVRPTDPALARVARAFLTETGRGIGAVVTVLGAVAVAGIAARGRSRIEAPLAGVVAVIAALGAASGGHAASMDGGQAALVGRGLHLLGSSVWVGGLAALVLLWPGLWRAHLAGVAAQGFSMLAGWAYVVVAASGLMTGYAVLGAFDPFGTTYARLMMAKALALLVLGGLGAWHRRRSLAGLDRAGARSFLRLAVGELALMATAVALAVVLSTTPPH